MKHFVFATVYGCLFFVTALLQSWTFQIRFLLHITDYYHEPMNNNVIENMFNSTTSFKSLKCHLLLHPGHTANIRRKSLLPKKSFMCYKFSKALRLFTQLWWNSFLCFRLWKNSSIAGIATFMYNCLVGLSIADTKSFIAIN